MTDVHGHGGHDNGLMLNGVSLDAAINEMAHAYQVPHSEHDGHAAEHPLIVRQRRISANTSKLEDKVKAILGTDVKASKEHADKMIKTLAFEVAQSDGYKGKLEDFTSEQARNYLTTAANTWKSYYWKRDRINQSNHEPCCCKWRRSAL